MAKARGIKLGSSFRLTSPVPLLANAYFLTTDERLAAGQLRDISWDCCQADAALYYRILPLDQCFDALGDPATQAGTWGTLEEHWTLQGQGGGGSGLPQYILDALYNASGPNASNHFATLQDVQAVGGSLTPGRVSYVEGNASNTQTPRVGDPLRPFQTVLAAYSANPGGLIIVRPGGNGTDSLGRQCYNETSIVLPGTAHVYCLPGVVFTSNINLGNYGGNQAMRSTWTGGIILNQLSVLRQVSQAYYAVITGVKTEGIGFIQAFSQCPGASSSTHTDTLEVRDCWGRNGASGGLRLTGNENFGFQRTRLVAWDCDFETAGAAALTITPHTAVDADASVVILRGATRLVSGSGLAILVNPAAISGAVPQGTVVVDERAQAGGGNVLTYQASFAATPSELVVLDTDPRAFAVVAAVNASGFQAQVVKTTDGTAWGPVRTAEADVQADLETAFGDASAPQTVLLLVQPTRLDASRGAFTLFSLS